MKGCDNIFEIKYYLNGIELKTKDIVLFNCFSHYGKLTKEYPIKIQNNKLYIVFGENNCYCVSDTSTLFEPIAIVNTEGSTT